MSMEPVSAVDVADRIREIVRILCKRLEYVRNNRASLERDIELECAFERARTAARTAEGVVSASDDQWLQTRRGQMLEAISPRSIANTERDLSVALDCLSAIDREVLGLGKGRS